MYSKQDQVTRAEYSWATGSNTWGLWMSTGSWPGGKCNANSTSVCVSACEHAPSRTNARHVQRRADLTGKQVATQLAQALLGRDGSQLDVVVVRCIDGGMYMYLLSVCFQVTWTILLPHSPFIVWLLTQLLLTS